MAYTNILSRRLSTEFINLGFSGNGRGEPELAKLINQIDRKRLVVLDYEANAGDSIRETLGTFVDVLREQDSDLPILIISKIRYANELYDTDSLESAEACEKFQADFVLTRRSAGDTNLHFLGGGTLLGDRADECTVDGIHPTDLGFMKMADGIEPAIRGILKTYLTLN